MAAELDNNIILEATGRQYGPDFALDVEKPPLTGATGIITSRTSITELLNIVAFLCNTTRNGTKINDKHSIDKTIYGEHGNAGIYTAAGTAGAPGAGAAVDTLFASANAPLFDLTNMAVINPIPGNPFIPQGLLKRTNDNNGKNAGDINTAHAPFDVSQQPTVRSTMKDCITQMITILEECREIFGPKGWAKLYGEMHGGGSTKNHIKRTHRQHRRRYSSKQN